MAAFTGKNRVTDVQRHRASIQLPNRKIPNFFLIGAPKCATTTLFYILKNHPDIFMPFEERYGTRSKWITKEPHFFCPDLDLHAHVSIKSEAEYLSLFDKAQNERRIGEASVCYLFSDDAPENIAKFCGESKIIVGLRNPVDWMKSWHHDMLDCGTETVVDFKQALELEDQRSQGKGIPRLGYWQQCLLYRKMARFSRHVEKYIELFGEDNVFVYTVDELRDDPQAVYNRIFEFLDVEPMKVEYLHVNESKELHFGYVQMQVLKQLLKRNESLFSVLRWLGDHNPQFVKRAFRVIVGLFPSTLKGEFDSGLRAELLREFEPEIRNLGRVINKDLSSWTMPVFGD